MEQVLSYLKFLVKTRMVSSIRSFLVSLFGGRVNTSEWEQRMLIINLEALGDLVIFTSVLKHYKKRFPEKKLYFLVKSGLGVEKIFKGTFVDEVETLDYRRFSSDPAYGASVIRRLRAIGFKKIINHDFSAAEINGKWIAVGAGAEEVVGYEGIGAELVQPFDAHQRKNLRVVMEEIHPRYTRIIPSIDALAGRVQEFPSALRHFIAIYEGATGFKEGNYSTSLPSPKESASLAFAPELKRGTYAVLGITASVSYKRWPLEKFAEVAHFLEQKNLKVVIAGSKSEKPLADRFEAMLKGRVENRAGQTSLGQLLALIGGAACVVTNDTSFVHLAVALKVPSVCITGGGQFGMFSDYGYSGSNRWVYKKSPCFGDNWRCGRGLPPDVPSPCIAPIGAREVIQEVGAALAATKASSRGTEKFRLGPCGGSFRPAGRKEKAKIKVIYAGIQAESYDSRRYPSFERENFYSTLKEMKGVSVIECPYDPIVGLGKKRFNEKLLELVRSEKPDLFFAFMHTDELDPATLLEIKKSVTSVAWFADDYWRFWNYSRQWPPFFDYVVTTCGDAVQWYRSCGFTNVIRSQWACNDTLYRRRASSKDIDVSFVGQWKPQRERMIQILRNAGVNAEAFGFGWPSGKLSLEKMLEIVSRSKISLNLNVRPGFASPRALARLFLKRSADRFALDFNVRDNFRAYMHFPTLHTHARPFELAGCGAFVASGRSKDIGEYYTEGKEMIFYDSEVDLIEKVKYYLARDSEREKIAAAGYERTIREHTYEKRFRDLFNLMGYNV